MIINVNKYDIYLPDIEENNMLIFSTLFKFPLHELGAGIKYLGYVLKPNNYGIAN